MSLYGVLGVAMCWFRSYLSQREQYVSITDMNSGYRLTEYGVPQRSIFGRLLFLIFINDFPKCSNFFNVTLPADDSKSPLLMNYLTFYIRTTLKYVSLWININKLKDNTSKCIFISFSYRKKLSLPPTSIASGYISETDSIEKVMFPLRQTFNF